jgi:formylglycine-generating enzyme required for sulfatase activity
LLIAMITGVVLILAVVGAVTWLASGSLFGPPTENNGDGTTPVQPPVTPPTTITNSLGMQFVRIPAGSFMMGSPETEKDRRADEHQHEVEITQDFYLGVYEITQEQYELVMGNNPSSFSSTGGGKDKVDGLDTRTFPVEMVSWHDAVKFCEKLNELPEERTAGRTYRLPSEAEWEYTCRGGVPSYQVFSSGDSLSSDQANFDGNIPYGNAPKGPFLGRTTTVGSYKPNAFGLYDMHGNVQEWCADWHDENYYNSSPRKDPTGPAEGSSRVGRGGSWNYYASYCRAAYRNRITPDYRSINLGFRLALVPSGGK